MATIPEKKPVTELADQIIKVVAAALTSPLPCGKSCSIFEAVEALAGVVGRIMKAADSKDIHSQFQDETLHMVEDMVVFLEEVHKQKNLPLAVDIMAAAELLAFLGDQFEKYRREHHDSDQSSGTEGAWNPGTGGG